MIARWYLIWVMMVLPPAIVVAKKPWKPYRNLYAKPYYPNNPFQKNFYVNWKPDYAQLSNKGYVMNLKLDNASGSGFQSKNKYIYGYTSMRIKLVPKNAAGVVVAYYMMSLPMETRNEFDFEFLGNVSGQPWICQTNIYTNGKGGREERIYLWFDPSKSFHTYSILWNHRQIVFYVDDYPIRVYRYNKITWRSYPNNQGMALYSSIWNGDSWATRGGRDKIDWTNAPFMAFYNQFVLDGCHYGDKSCLKNTQKKWWDQWPAWRLSPKEQRMYTWVRSNFMVYDYCKDSQRYPIPYYDCASPPW